MLRLLIARCEPVLGSDSERATRGAIVHFVCDDSHPDPEEYAREIVGQNDFLLVSVEAEHQTTPELLLSNAPELYEMWSLRGYAVEYVGWEKE